MQYSNKCCSPSRLFLVDLFPIFAHFFLTLASISDPSRTQTNYKLRNCWDALWLAPPNLHSQISENNSLPWNLFYRSCQLKTYSRNQSCSISAGISAALYLTNLENPAMLSTCKSQQDALASAWRVVIQTESSTPSLSLTIKCHRYTKWFWKDLVFCTTLFNLLWLMKY